MDARRPRQIDITLEYKCSLLTPPWLILRNLNNSFSNNYFHSGRGGNSSVAFEIQKQIKKFKSQRLRSSYALHI
jgi:hypothetical protein